MAKKIAKKKTPTRTQRHAWEYLEVTNNNGAVSLEALGYSNWELVSIYNKIHESAPTFIFKRRVLLTLEDAEIVDTKPVLGEIPESV